MSVCFLIKPALSIELKAGFSMDNFPVLFYQANRFSVSGAKELNILKVHGFNVLPRYKVAKIKLGKTAVFRHTFANLGNCSELVNFKLKSAPAGSEVKIRVGSTFVNNMVVPEGASLDFEVLFKPPPFALKGKTYFLQMLVSLTEKDGDAYLGFDGRLHGGKDEITIIDTVQL